MHSTVLIIDFGSQVTQLIARRVREAGVYCEIHPFQNADAAFAKLKPAAVILSGGPASVTEFESPRAPDAIFKAGIPIVAETEASTKIEASTSHDWKFGEQNSTKQSYSHTSAVEVPPRKHIQLIAQITKSTLDVPYRAKIRAADGTTAWIEGTWNGVATANLVVRQVDVA